MEFKTVKIVIFVPKTHTDIVRTAMGDAGAGQIGNYDYCSFSIDGIGRSKPQEGAHPFIGQVGKLEEIVEERIECVCESSNAKKVIAAIRKVHPYDEIAFDIYPLLQESEL